MNNAAKSLFDSLKSYQDIDRLAEESEPESIFLECKAPSQQKLNQDLRITLGVALSGFSNTNGGVIIWGAATTRKSHSGLDIITQVEPIANCKKFSTHILNKIPTLTIPSLTNCENKVLKKRNSDTKGVIVTYIPPYTGDPVQHIGDEYFYFRSGDEFVKTPYQMLKRLFASSDTPSLSTTFFQKIIKLDKTGFWDIPIVINNNSSAVAENVIVQVEVLNPTSCKNIHPVRFSDVSEINPGKTVFTIGLSSVLHRGIPTIVGSIKVQMLGKKRLIKLGIDLFANKMIAKQQRFCLNLCKGKFSYSLTKEVDVY